jgi:hypothetical protein
VFSGFLVVSVVAVGSGRVARGVDLRLSYGGVIGRPAASCIV